MEGSKQLMFWAVQGRAPPQQRVSLRNILRHTPAGREKPRVGGRIHESSGEAPSRIGLRPTKGESMAAWIEAVGWDEEADVKLHGEAGRVWGKAANQRPLVESEV
jgi:hypothetical protein